MKKEQRIEIIETILSIAEFWMSIENAQSSYSVLSLLNEISIPADLKKKQQSLYDDWNNLFKKENPGNTCKPIKIPEKYKVDSNSKLLWITSVIILNLFEAKCYEVAYSNLMDMSQEWPELYIFTLSNLKKTKSVNDIYHWLMPHFYFAKDLIGTEVLDFAGYRLTKI